jgi:hypothetical protein
MAFRRTDLIFCRTAADAGRREAVASQFPQKETRKYHLTCTSISLSAKKTCLVPFGGRD